MATAKDKRGKAKKSKRKLDSVGVAHVKSSFNNTLITMTDLQGNVITWSSGGHQGRYKGSRKSTAFAAQLANTSGGLTDDIAIFVGNGASLFEVVRQGDPAPDGNGVFLDFSPAAYHLNNRGQVLFQAILSGAANGATEGVFLGTASGIEQLAR